MKIRSTSSGKKENETAKKYPWLGIAGGKKVVLFVSSRSGMVIDPGTSGLGIGYSSAHWLEEDYDPYYGTVTITSEN